MNTILEVRNLAKQYRIRHLPGGYLSLRERLLSGFRSGQRTSETFWALNDISFNVDRGESIGIIGRNGAGKSTLLKILSRITLPTKGRIVTRGRLASLLEVGTGFHQELTGRENIFLNGSILGMKRWEITKKFDEIVDFSGVERFLDTPLKHYSSGMQLRLAFAVAAFLEPEILVVDEVLAVGDSEFQQKCIGKMKEVSSNEGRTILFVSHNLAAVTQLCTRGILLRNSKLVMDGPVDDVVHEYVSFNRRQFESGVLNNFETRKGSGLVQVEQITMLNESNNEIQIGRTGSALIFRIQMNKAVANGNGGFRMDFAIDTEQDMRVGWFSTEVAPGDIKNDFQTLYLTIPKFPYGAGNYYLTFYATIKGEVVDFVHQAFNFSVEEGDYFGTGKTIPKSQTFIYTDHTIHVS